MKQQSSLKPQCLILKFFPWCLSFRSQRLRTIQFISKASFECNFALYSPSFIVIEKLFIMLKFQFEFLTIRFEIWKIMLRVWRLGIWRWLLKVSLHHMIKRVLRILHDKIHIEMKALRLTIIFIQKHQEDNLHFLVFFNETIKRSIQLSKKS